MSERYEERRSFWRLSVIIAISALVAAALVCVFWVLFGGESGIIGRALATILLLAAFAGAAVFDAGQAPRRPQWYVLLSMVGWVVILLAGAIKIWTPIDAWWTSSYTRFMEFVAIVLVVRLAILHARLLIRTQERNATVFTRACTAVTVGLSTVLSILLLLPLMFDARWSDFYWRVVVAVAILAAVGTALVPLVKALNSPRVVTAPPAPAALPWPTYADGRTPLPIMPDGSPDWNAYYTGRPTYPQPPVPGYSAPAPPMPPVPHAQPAPPAPPVSPASPAPPSPPAPPAPPR
jgi:hypothetical protein